MITVIDGPTGSGKTLLMSRLLARDNKYGHHIYANFPLLFPNDNENITRWHQLDELYHLTDGVIAIDEGQKLFDARRWASLPIGFMEKIAQHRKHALDIYTTTQDLGHIDLRVRSNIHERFSCQSLFRFPKNDRVKPVLQIIRYTRRNRQMNTDTNRINWITVGSKLMFVSRYWTKTIYDTYGDIGFERYIAGIKFEKKLWRGKIYSRDLINRGKARM